MALVQWCCGFVLFYHSPGMSTLDSGLGLATVCTVVAFQKPLTVKHMVPSHGDLLH